MKKHAPGTLTGAVRLCRALQRAGKKAVTTNGCFDILHPGHIRILEKSRSLGDALVVLVNSDASVRRLKGPSRPLQGENDRMTVLAALRCVDYVCMFDEDTPAPALARLRPDIHVKGGDYTLADLPEAEVVIRGGGKVAIVPLVRGKSTTSLITRMKGRR